MRVPTGAERERRRGNFAILGLLAAIALAPLPLYGKRAYRTIVAGLQPTIEFERVESRSRTGEERTTRIANWIASFREPIPHLLIDIKFDNFEKLRRLRDEALRSTFLFRSEDDVVPATIRHDGRSVKVRLRLKGDFLDHLRTTKWSLRVETRGGDQLFGMRRFSLQAPHTRYYHHEALFLDHAREEGLLAVRYSFVDVTLNGDHLGLMALEEHFSKELLESQQRPEGVIVRYDETDFWRSYERSELVEREAQEHGMKRYVPRAFDNWKVAPISPFRGAKVAESTRLTRQADLATAMLRGLAAGTMRPSEVFDADAVGKYLALCDLWGSWHPLRFHNVRFYLNPVTLELEPIGFDGSVGKNWEEKSFAFRNSALYDFLIDDPRIREAFIEHALRFSREEYLQWLRGFLEEREARYLSVLHREFPDLPRFDFDSIRRKAELRRSLTADSTLEVPRLMPTSVIDAEPLPQPRAVYAYVVRDDQGGRWLELLNPLSVPVQVDRLEVHTAEGVIPRSEIADVELPLTLPPNYFGPAYRQTPPPEALRWALAPGFDPERMRITGSATPGHQDRAYEFEASSYVAAATAPPFVRQADAQRLLDEFPFLAWDGESFRTTAGRWVVDGPLEIPPRLRVEEPGVGARIVQHAGLTVTAGTTLVFVEDAFLRLGGPLHLAGRADAPVTLGGDGGRPWGGVVVDRSPVRSSWSHAVVEGTAITQRGAWALTGGVTFYESDVTMTDTRLQGTVAEDALNVIRSLFELHRVTIVGTASDAFDSDFSEGVVDDSRFEGIGGDAIDASGSRVRVARSSFEGVRDKALSVGENSDVSAVKLRIRDAGAAIASKDGSTATVSDLTLERIRHIALMAYNKKPEYGRATLTVTTLDFDGSATLHAAQRGHRITVDGKKMFTQRIDVDALYRSGFMRK